MKVKGFGGELVVELKNVDEECRKSGWGYFEFHYELTLRESRIPDGKHPFGGSLCFYVLRACTICLDGKWWNLRICCPVSMNNTDGEKKCSLIFVNPL